MSNLETVIHSMAIFNSHVCKPYSRWCHYCTATDDSNHSAVFSPAHSLITTFRTRVVVM